MPAITVKDFTVVILHIINLQLPPLFFQVFPLLICLFETFTFTLLVAFDKIMLSLWIVLERLRDFGQD